MSLKNAFYAIILCLMLIPSARAQGLNEADPMDLKEYYRIRVSIDSAAFGIEVTTAETKEIFEKRLALMEAHVKALETEYEVKKARGENTPEARGELKDLARRKRDYSVDLIKIKLAYDKARIAANAAAEKEAINKIGAPNAQEPRHR